MPIKVDGTNGILQSYDFQTPVTGFSYTFPTGIQTVILAPAATLASGTVTMPAVPTDGMVVTIESTQQITALTVSGNSGQSIVGGTMTMLANQPESFMYRSANTTWYPIAGAANSQLVSGTAQNSTSGTAIDFTGIPSWVKRVTVMFQGVSTNGTDYVELRLGTSSGVEATGYLGTFSLMQNASTSAVVASTTGFIIDGATNAAAVRHGAVRITLMNGNTWVIDGAISRTDTATCSVCAGVKTLSGTLDRIRLTAQAGANTFDAGSINILYE